LLDVGRMWIQIRILIRVSLIPLNIDEDCAFLSLEGKDEDKEKYYGSGKQIASVTK
jgi:hypothetical protein